jgi:hypothetical protein
MNQVEIGCSRKVMFSLSILEFWKNIASNLGEEGSLENRIFTIARKANGGILPIRDQMGFSFAFCEVMKILFLKVPSSL